MAGGWKGEKGQRLHSITTTGLLINFVHRYWTPIPQVCNRIVIRAYGKWTGYIKDYEIPAERKSQYDETFKRKLFNVPPLAKVERSSKTTKRSVGPFQEHVHDIKRAVC